MRDAYGIGEGGMRIKIYRYIIIFLGFEEIRVNSDLSI